MESSDQDFWEPAFQFQKPPPIVAYKRKSIQEKIQTIRLAGVQQGQIIQIQQRNRNKKQVLDKVKAIQQEYEAHSIKLGEQYNQLKLVMQKKDKDIAFLSRYIGEQEVLISEYRMKLLNPPIKKSDEQKKFKDLQSKNKQLKKQVELLKELCGDYLRDKLGADQQAKLVEQEMNQLKSSYEQIIQKLKVEHEKTEKNLSEKLGEISSQYQGYKSNSESELIAREVLYKRQQEFIHQLQTELKNAKFVMTNSVLTSRLNDRLNQEVQQTARIRTRSFKTNKKSVFISKRKNMTRLSADYAKEEFVTPKVRERPVFHVSYRSPSMNLTTSSVKLSY